MRPVFVHGVKDLAGRLGALIKDGEWHTAVVDLASLSFWRGKVNLIRFDYFDSCAEGDVMYVKEIRLVP